MWRAARQGRRHPIVTDASPAPQPTGFLLAYAAAVAGGVVAFTPFLTIILPLRMQNIAATGVVDLLAATAFAGALTASVANIGFGWASDRTRNRRGWIAAGLVLSCALLLASGLADTATKLIASVVAWQIALNMMLAPLAAWGGDCVPDCQKGRLGGFLALAPAAGALSGVLITAGGFVPEAARVWVIVALTCTLVGPVLLMGGGRDRQLLMQDFPKEPRDEAKSRTRRPAARMWLARLLVQVSEAAMFAFLLVWLRSLDPSFPESAAAAVIAATMVASIPAAMWFGRWSDRTGEPFTPLLWLSGAASISLMVMAIAPSRVAALVAYVAFGIFGTTFLSLHSAQTLRILPRARTRGRDLGFFNLTNTVPSLIMALLAVWLVPRFGFSALFLALALSALGATLLLVELSQPAPPLVKPAEACEPPP